MRPLSRRPGAAFLAALALALLGAPPVLAHVEYCVPAAFGACAETQHFEWWFNEGSCVQGRPFFWEWRYAKVEFDNGTRHNTIELWNECDAYNDTSFDSKHSELRIHWTITERATGVEVGSTEFDWYGTQTSQGNDCHVGISSHHNPPFPEGTSTQDCVALSPPMLFPVWPL